MFVGLDHLGKNSMLSQWIPFELRQTWTGLHHMYAVFVADRCHHSSDHMQYHI